MSSRAHSHAQSPTTSSVLVVEPTTAYFPPPYNTRSIRNTINLSNTSDGYLVFKVRSSNPERFVVKPTAGFATPTSVTRLFVTLKRTNDDLVAPNAKKDRFRITVKAVKGTSVNTKDDAKKAFEQIPADQTVLETDLWCNYGPDVPSNAVVSFILNDDASEVGGATPSVIHVRAHEASPGSTGAAAGQAGERGGAKVSFGATAAAAAAAAGTAPSEAKSVQDALVNAQRVKDSIQSDIVALQASEKKLKEKLEAGSAKSDAMSREALELVALRTKVKLSRHVLAQRTAALTDAQGAESQAAERAAGSAAAADSSLASAAGVAPPASAAKTDTAQASDATDGSTAHTSKRGASPPKRSSGASMYLSTVMMWMIAAYLAGIAYRVYVHDGIPRDPSLLLPSETREALASLMAFFKPKLF